jgi:Flp pilus assembly protein TadD
MAAGRFEQAHVEFRNAAYIDPDDADVSVFVGEAAEKCGKLREAAQRYQYAIDKDDRQLGARARLGRLYALAGRLDKAQATIAPGMALARRDPDLLTVRALVKSRRGDERGAFEDATEAVEISPANENAVALLAGMHRKAGHIRKARVLVEHALQTKPQSVDLKLILAQLLLVSGRQDEAEAQLHDVVRLEPGRAGFGARLAQVSDGR